MSKRWEHLVAVFVVICSMATFAWAEEGKAKNIVLFIGDGMGITAIQAARLYQGGPAHRLNLDRLEHTALCHTYSASSFITDSAAAATAIATGEKVKNGVLGISPDARKLDSIAVMAHREGKAVGLVTNTRVTHATPAGFYAHVDSRASEAKIAEQALESGLDLFMGGGADFFLPAGSTDALSGRSGKRGDDRDLLASARESGYEYVWDLDQLNALKPTAHIKVLGLFAGGYMPLQTDMEDPKNDQCPSLSEMTRKAIDLLSARENGFFLMVEGGQIDGGGHSNKATNSIYETLELDRALGAALEHVDLSETLVLLTADHETGGMAVVPADEKSGAGEHVIAGGAVEFGVTWASGPGAVSQPASAPSKPGAGEAEPSGDAERQVAAILKKSGSHSPQDVILAASGPGAEQVKGFIENTEIFSIMKEALLGE